MSVLATRNVADRIAPAFVARQFGMPTPPNIPIYFGLNVNNEQPIVEVIDEDDGYIESTQRPLPMKTPKHERKVLIVESPLETPPQQYDAAPW